MSETADLLQTFLRGIERPNPEESGYGVATNTQRNFDYLRLSGTTAQRPSNAPPGWTYFDSTVENLVVYDGDDWVEIEGTGGGLTPPASPGDNGKVGIAASGDVVWTALSALTVGNATNAVNADSADTATVASSALAVTISGPTDIGFGTVTDGHLLTRSGTNFIGVAASTLSVASAATALGITVSGPTALTFGSVSNNQLLIRSGTTVIGVAASTLSVAAAVTAESADYALGLTFGASDLDMAGTAPTTNQLLVYTGTALAGLDPGNILRRKTSSNTSTAAIVFTANVVWTWNGSTTVSLTADTTGAIDGAEITLLFPAGSMNSFALHANIDPTGLVAGTFTSNLKAYLLRLKYHACGPCIEVLNFAEVTDL